MNFSKKANINFICKYFSTSKVYLNEESNQFRAVIDEEASKKFINSNVQKLLKKLTGLDLDKVFRARAIGQKLMPPVYKFMTNDQVQKAAKEALLNAKGKLQMPPLVPIKEDKLEILQQEPKIIGYDNAKYVFTDITFGLRQKDRVIVVREPDGTLRKAYSFEKHRMNQIYFPITGRTLRHPKMFQKEYLQLLLDKQEFEFILDRACCQFEPEDKEFHDVTFATYAKINECMAFDKFRSTRHYGPLCFYLALNKNIDNLLLENLQYDRVQDAVDAIHLYNLVNPDATSVNLTLDPNNRLEFIREFIKLESKNPEKLLEALQNVVDIPEKKSQAVAV